MVYLIVMALLTIPLTGCLEEVAEKQKIQAEELIEVENPCSMPSEPILQSMTTIPAHGVDRYFRLTVPSSEAGTKLPIVLAFHGGGGAEEAELDCDSPPTEIVSHLVGDTSPLQDKNPYET